MLKPNVSLYSLTKDEAVFVETTEGINVYSSDEDPFLYFAQSDRGKYVIKCL